MRVPPIWRARINHLIHPHVRFLRTPYYKMSVLIITEVYYYRKENLRQTPTMLDTLQPKISVKIVSGVERSGIPDTIKMSEAAGRSYGDSIEQLRSFEQLIHVVL